MKQEQQSFARAYSLKCFKLFFSSHSFDMKNNQSIIWYQNGGHTIRGFINQEILGIVSFTFHNGVVKKNGHFRKKKKIFPKKTIPY